ncbi:MAG: hypothetical protein JWO45_1734 [Spartobacteria bacterium]|nr:hypothetical protein [Spartobacteria bacterium]
MQLLHIQFGPLPHSAPQNGATVMMHFEHMLFRFLSRVTENALKNHGDVGHQIDRIIVDDDLPRQIDILLRFNLLFYRGLADG